MGLIKRIEQTNNLYQTWVEITSSHAEVLWLDHEMTEAEAQTTQGDKYHLKRLS